MHVVNTPVDIPQQQIKLILIRSEYQFKTSQPRKSLLIKRTVSLLLNLPYSFAVHVAVGVEEGVGADYEAVGAVASVDEELADFSAG